jgi:hypothetical protein
MNKAHTAFAMGVAVARRFGRRGSASIIRRASAARTSTRLHLEVSLARHSRAAHRRDFRIGRTSWAMARSRVRVRQWLANETVAVALAAIAVFATFAPWPLPFDLPAGLAADSRTFLGVLWQVVAATAALSIAVVLFVFQAVYAVRFRGTLHDFARDAWLYPAILLAVSALLAIGLTLAVFDPSRPVPTWSVGWAAALGLLQITSVGMLFMTTLRAIEPDALRRRQIRRIERLFAELALQLRLRRAADVYLRAFCGRYQVTLVPWGIAPGLTDVQSRKSGRVVDVRLRLLRKLAEAAGALEVARPEIIAGFGGQVAKSQVVLRVARPFRFDARVRKVVRVRRFTLDDDTRAALRALHENGMRAIRDGQVNEYRELTKAYQAAVLQLLRA